MMTSTEYTPERSLSSPTLLDEARGLIERSRQALSNTDIVLTTHTHNEKRKNDMTVESNAAQAGELYANGKSVAEVAAALSVTYAKARKLIKDSGTPVRDASARLKGRTRKIRS